jgi:DNA-binding PadR family transcriptional regulator
MHANNIRRRTMADHVNEDLDLSPSGYALIAMIDNGVTTGYAMKRQLERFASFFWSASHGQIYPQLRRLEGAGMIAGRDTVSAGRLRREYAVTATGEEQLRRYLADPPEPTIWVQNEGILRLMMIDWSDRELVQEHVLKLRTVGTVMSYGDLAALSALSLVGSSGSRRIAREPARGSPRWGTPTLTGSGRRGCAGSGPAWRRVASARPNTLEWSGSRAAGRCWVCSPTPAG